MSLEEFVQELQQEHKEDLDAVEELLRVLEQIEEKDTEIYRFFTTSNL